MQLGKFRSPKQVLTIDGSTEPSSEDRFCLGLLSNVHHDIVIEEVRRHIYWQGYSSDVCVR